MQCAILNRILEEKKANRLHYGNLWTLGNNNYQCSFNNCHIYTTFLKMLCYTGSFLLYPGFSPVGVTGGYALAEVCRLLIVVAPLVAEHGLQDMQASARASFSSCGPQA